MDKRHKDKDWSLPTREDGKIETWDGVKIALLMDLRDELKALNRLLHCQNFIAIPRVLKEISKNTAKKRRPKK